jgi:hypothetical protein
MPFKAKQNWIGRNRLIELLQEVPWDARLAVNENGNLTFTTGKAHGYVDFADETVETIPDHCDQLGHIG